MNTSLSGWTSVVTGSTAGIGYAIAEELARAGASVVINGRTAERVDAAVQSLSKAIPGAQLRAGDGFRERLHGGIDTLRGAAVDDHRRAGAREFFRDRVADARGGAGDDGSPAGEGSIHGEIQ